MLIDQKDSERALRAVHSRFYLSDVPIGVGIVGPGLIGGTLIEQLREQVRGSAGARVAAVWCGSMLLTASCMFWARASLVACSLSSCASR